MTKKICVLAAVCLLLASQRPHAQAPTQCVNHACIYFVDIGQGASTLIVSPAGKTLLVDGGPPGSGAKITSLMATLGITTIDYTILTHYHIDHMGGLIEIMNAGKVAGVAYDNGDDPAVQPPGTSTSPTSTRGTYLNYVTATGNAGITRQTVSPGSFIDLGGGMRATFVAAGGRLLSGGQVAITNADLNSESISTLIEYNDFDYLVSGDMTGGGSTSTAKTPDVETYVAQMVGDVDVVQLDHHGSTTANNQTFLRALKAEVAFAQAGETNTFGHPNRETANKYLNTPDTVGATFAGTGVPPSGVGPVFYENESPVAGDDRVTLQAYTGAGAGNAGNGTILLSTDGTTTYSLSSFDDGGTRLTAPTHTYAVDGASTGVTTDFKPTVVVQTTPTLPLANEPVTVAAAVNDRESPVASVTLAYAINGVAQPPVAMTFASGAYQATIPAQPDGTRVDYTVTGIAGVQTSSYSLGYFSGVTAVGALRTLNALGEPAYTGYAARIRGTVSASGFSSGTNDDYVQDATGAINVYRSTDTPTAFTSTTPGQFVEAFGRVGFNGGRLRLDLTESVEKPTSPFGVVVISTQTEPTPIPVTIAGLATNFESFEGQFVSIANAQIVSGTIPPTPQALDAFVTISDGTGTLQMKIDHDTDVEGFTPAPTFTAIGIVQQDDYLRPFDSGYNLTPRSRVDLGASASAPTPLITIGAARIDAINNVDGTPGPDFVPDLLNQTVRIRGTVSSIDFRGGNGIEYYIQDGTGGVDLFNSGTNFGPFAIGDTVEALGTITQFFGLTELTVTSVSLVSHDGAPAAQAITLAQLASGGGEAFEGQLVRVDNVNITSGLYPATNGSAALTITDPTGTAQIFVDSDTDIDGTATPSLCTTLSITGPLGQHATTSLDNAYQIVPRSLADIVVTGGTCPALTASLSPSSFDATNVGSVSLATLTITNGGSSSLTLTTPFTITGTDASQFSVGAPATTTLSGGASTTATVTFAPTTAGSKSATLNIASTAGATTVSLTGTGQAVGVSSSMVISQFRTRGPSGGNDEFIEIYNNSDSAVDISGWQILGSSNTAPTGNRATVPANVVLPGRAHYLFVNTAASGYSNVAVPGNTSYTTGIGDNGGIALAMPSPASTIIDQVGVTTINTGYREGTPLATQTTTNGDRGYQRNPGATSVTLNDSNNNINDFTLLTQTAPHNIVIIASPTSVNFGSAAPGDTRTQNVTIRNLLLVPVTLSAPTVTGTDATAFFADNPASFTLAAGATTTVGVTFQPSDAGAKSATLAVISTGGGSITIPLSGTATGGLGLNPTSIDFGTVTPGSVASTTETITNSDPTPVTLTGFSLVGPNATEFAIGAPGTNVLVGGASTNFPVQFQPNGPGVKMATVQISTSGGSTRQLPLTGTGTCPAITVSGPLPNGFTSVAYTGVLTASGSDAPYSFGVTSGTLPNGLTLGASGILSGTPTAIGPFTFTVQATSVNGCSGSASLTVTITPAPVLITASLAPTAFGAVPVGTTSTAALTVINVSATVIALSTPFAITGPDAAVFAATAPAATTLAPGASTTATVSFSPATSGARSATLTAVPVGGAPVPLTLTGAGAVTTPVVISQFRTRGPSGGNDEFVEIYNNTDAPIDISGWKLLGSSNAAPTGTRATVPANVMLPGRAHYLFVNATTPGGYSGTAPGNVTYTTGVSDNGGIALAHADGTTIADQVGVTTTGTAYREGTPLATPLTTSVDRGYTRKAGPTAGSLQDTDDNLTDFALTTPSTPESLSFVVTPTRIDFGSAPLGDVRSANVTVRNMFASASISVSSPSLAAPFSAGPPSAATLSGGASATIPLTFQPESTGTFTATLNVGVDEGSAAVQLTGVGTPGITVPSSLDLGTIEPGASASAPVTITNDDTVAIVLTPPFAINGPDAAAFGVGNPVVTGLSAGDTTNATVTFTSSVLGAKSATLVVTSTNGGTRLVSLNGLVACPAITVAATLPAAEYGSPYSHAVTASGATAPYTFAITSGALPSGVSLDPSGAMTGTPVALGTFTVTVEATAASGCTGSATFTLAVVDTTPPVLTAPSSITQEATAASTPVTFSATATDIVDGLVTPICAPASGAGFSVGTTTVNCTATDAHSNSASGSFTVTVTDHTAPSLTLPPTQTATATTPAGAVVTFAASASDLVDGARPVVCAPASGSTFPVGASTVTCTASDTHGNTATGTFTVSVTTAVAPGRMVGDASIQAGSVTRSFAFLVQEQATGADAGALLYTARTTRPGPDQIDTFTATMITSVAFFNVPGVSPGHKPASGIDTVSFSGVGRWNGRSGYAFDAVAVDAGEPGRGHDTFAITIRDGSGLIVSSVNATITDGNIQSLRMP